MIDAGSRSRNQPAPPAVIAEALVTPNRDPARRWLVLLDDEQWPRAVALSAESIVMWSSLWAARPDARIRFDLAPDGHGGTSLSWTLLLEVPLPDASQLGHFRKRINVLINADLRFSLGQ